MMSMVLKGIHHQLSTGGITKMLFKFSGQRDYSQPLFSA
jgi:hypothetical protein